VPARIAAKRRALLYCATAVYFLTLIIAVTGGGVLTVGALRVSARSVRNPLTILLIVVVAAYALGPRGRRWPTLRDEWTAIVRPVEAAVVRLLSGRGQLATWAVVFLLATAVAMLGLIAGSHVAGGSDSYGYLSQARLWKSGVLRVEQPLLDDLPAGVPPETFVPLGYRLSPRRDSIVPVYPPGFPLLLAVFELIGGPGLALFVIPLLAGVTVFCTYLLGVRLAGPAVGVAAAALLSTSPAFIHALTHAPMADIPAMAWWVLALVLGLASFRGAALLSGLAAGAAILTRPNLVPLAIVAAALPVLQTYRRRASLHAAVQSLLLFLAGPIAAAVVVALLNTLWYGGPATSGYGNLAGVLYRWEFVWADLVRYPGWLWDTQPFTLLFAVAGAVVLWKRRVAEDNARDMQAIGVCAAFALAVCLSYAFYLPLPEWWSLRLLFPAFPIMCVAAAVGVMALPARALRVAAVAMVVALGVASSREKGAFDSEPDWRFATIGQYVADTLPPQAALLTMFHSGSARYYSGRLTLRWDMIGPEQLDPLVADLQRRGYVPFILLDDWEEPEFSARFKGASRLAALDWEPVVVMPSVKLFAARPQGGDEAP
jgi:hypothetical protein